MKDDEAKLMYSVGDSIVHTHYGIGEIIRIEDKKLNGKKTTCYVVKIKDGTFWVPVDKADNERTRPIVSPEKITGEVVEVLEADPQEMASHFKTAEKG